MKKVVFIVSHLGSKSEDLVEILNANSRIEIFFTQNMYSYPLNLKHLTENDHKLNNAAAIYGDQLFYNNQFSCKALLKICKFIYVIRDSSSLFDIKLNINKAYDYYRFRLRRMCEMAKITGGILLTHQDILNNRKFKEIEGYLNLKEPLQPKIRNLENVSKKIELAELKYEKYLFLMKQYLV